MLAVLLILVTAGLNFNKHFCGDTLVSLSIYKPAKDCSMTMGSTDAKGFCGKEVVKKGNCCKDESQFLKLKDDFVPEKMVKQISPDLVAFVFALVIVNDSQQTSTSGYQNYKPPLIERDMPVFVHSFLC